MGHKVKKMKITKPENGNALSQPNDNRSGAESKMEDRDIVSVVKKKGLELQPAEEDSIFSSALLFFRRPFFIGSRFSEKKYSAAQFKKDAIFSLMLLFFTKNF